MQCYTVRPFIQGKSETLYDDSVSVYFIGSKLAKEILPTKREPNQPILTRFLN